MNNNNNVGENAFRNELLLPECIELFSTWLRTDEGRDFLRRFYEVHTHQGLRQRLLSGQTGILPSIHQMYIAARLTNDFAPRDIVTPNTTTNTMEAGFALEARQQTNMAQFVAFLDTVLGHLFTDDYFTEARVVLALLRQRGHIQDNGFVNEHIRDSIIAMYVSARSRRSFAPTIPQAVAAQFIPPRPPLHASRPSRARGGAGNQPSRGHGGQADPPMGAGADAIGHHEGPHASAITRDRRIYGSLPVGRNDSIATYPDTQDATSAWDGLLGSPPGHGEEANAPVLGTLRAQSGTHAAHQRQDPHDAEPSPSSVGDIELDQSDEPSGGSP